MADRQVFLVVFIFFSKNSFLLWNSCDLAHGENLSRPLCSVYWIVAVILSASLCSYAIYDSFLSWSKNPVILTLSHETKSIGEIPFPAVVICPMTKTTASEFNFTDVYRSIFKLDGINSRNVTEEE